MTGRQRWCGAAAAVGLANLIAIAVVLSGLLDAVGLNQLVADLTGFLGAVAAIAAFTWTGWRHGGDERRWRWLLALALVWWATAHAMWTWYRSFDHDTPVFPREENALYLGLPLFGFFALLSMVRKDRESAKRQGTSPPHRVVVLDGFIVVGSLMALTWEIAFDAVRHADSARASELLMVAAYTAADLVLIVIAILTAITLHRMVRPPLAWLVAGLIAIGFSDAVYIYTISNAMEPPPVADIGYMSGPVMLLLAATVHDRRFTRRTPRTPLLFLPYVPLAAVCAFTVFNSTIAGRPHVGEIYCLVGVVALVVVRHLVTLRQLHAAHQQLAHQATHDPLTGVANRTLLLLQLARALPQAQQQRDDLGLLYVDLDHFKELNDTLGHEAGDAVLRTVAARLAACTRNTDMVTRVGGDEFVVLLNPAPVNPEELSERIRSTLLEPVSVDGSPYPISASLGYARVNAGDTPDQALTRADTAMYRAKQAGSAPFPSSTIEESSRGERPGSNDDAPGSGRSTPQHPNT